MSWEDEESPSPQEQVAHLNIDEWHKMDLVKRAKKRSSTKVTQESYLEDVALVEKVLADLKPYDEDEIMNEVASWDLTIPQETYDIDELQEVYSRLTSYRFRIAYLIKIVSTYAGIYAKTYNSFKNAASGVLPGGTVPEKKGHGEALAIDFLVGTFKTEPLAEYLREVREGVLFAAQNLARILREREALLKVNQGLITGGNAAAYDRQSRSNDGPRVKTRNYRLETEADEEE